MSDAQWAADRLGSFGDMIQALLNERQEVYQSISYLNMKKLEAERDRYKKALEEIASGGICDEEGKEIGHYCSCMAQKDGPIEWSRWACVQKRQRAEQALKGENNDT